MTITRVGLALALVAGVAVAQNPPTAQPKAAPQPRAQQAPAAGQPMQPGQMGQMGPMGMMRGQPNRQQLEQQIRNRIGNQLKKSLNLSDDQFAKLQATNKRYEEKRHLLVEQERDARMSMRDLMISGDTTNAAKVSAGLDKMLQIQRQRFETVEQEQKELSGFLTPMQRARYLGMQEQLFRRMQALRAQPGARGARPGMGQGMGMGMGQGMGQPGAGARLRTPNRPMMMRGMQPRPDTSPNRTPPIPPLGSELP